MARDQNLHSKFEELLGSKNVYYQPPPSVMMSYPCIRYMKKRPSVKHADDKKYLKRNCYEVTVISRLPDDPVIDKLMDLPYCTFDRHYESDNLNHDVLTLYY